MTRRLSSQLLSEAFIWIRYEALDSRVHQGVMNLF